MASILVHAFATGGGRRLAWTTAALIPFLVVVELVDQVNGDTAVTFDRMWALISALLPLAAALAVRVGAAIGLGRAVQWLLALAAGAVIVLVVAVAVAALSTPMR